MGRWRREDYPGEYNSYHGMKRRVKDEGRPLHEAFATFESFMDVLGPKPEGTFSLERIKYNGPYSPENVKWGSKEEQANNRRNTRRLTYSGQRHPDWLGKELPLTQWARLLEVPAFRLRRRLSDGWSETEAIDGQRDLISAASFGGMTKTELADYRPWSTSDESAEKDYLRYRQTGEARVEYRARIVGEETLQLWHELILLLKEPDKANLKALRLSKQARDVLALRYGVSEEEFQMAYAKWDKSKAELAAARAQLGEWADAFYGRQKVDPSAEATKEVLRRLQPGTVKRHDDEDDLDDYF